MTRDEAKLRWYLYMCIQELEYVQCAEDHSQCASSKGRGLVREGMKLLGVPDLSADTADGFLKLANIQIESGRVGEARQD